MRRLPKPARTRCRATTARWRPEPPPDAWEDGRCGFLLDEEEEDDEDNPVRSAMPAEGGGQALPEQQGFSKPAPDQPEQGAGQAQACLWPS